MTEQQIRTWIAATQTYGADHPNLEAFKAWALELKQRYDASRRQWRAMSPGVDVSALEAAYGVSPSLRPGQV